MAAVTLVGSTTSLCVALRVRLMQLPDNAVSSRRQCLILRVLTRQTEWVGSAPFCASGSGQATCPSDYPIEDTYSLYGAGGESVCLSGKFSLLLVA
jgi:hypothetical protein